MADPQVTALDQLFKVALDGQGSAMLPRLPIDLSMNPAAIQGPPPKLGEHSRDILREAGYNVVEIEDLFACGAVG